MIKPTVNYIFFTTKNNDFRKSWLHMIFKSINKDYFWLQMISVYFVLHTSTTILKPPVLACHIEPGSPPV